MKTINFRRLAGRVLAFAISAFAITSCGGSSDTLEVIPADIEYAVKVNLRQPLENAGCTVTDNGEITLSQAITDALNETPGAGLITRQALSALEGVNLSEFYFFDYNDSHIILSTAVDTDKVAQTLTKYAGEPKKVDDMDMYLIDSTWVIVEGDHIWIPSEWEQTAAAGTIRSVIDAARQKNISTVPGIEDFISADNTVAAIVTSDKLDLPSQYRNSWLCGSLKFVDSTASGELTLLDSEGKRVAFGESFGEISTDFLRYIPDNTNLVAALGPVENPQIKAIIDMAAANLNDYGKFLTALDGTIAMAIDATELTEKMPMILDNPMNNPMGMIDGIIMAHYPENVGDELVTTIRDAAQLSGQVPESAGNGQYSITMDGQSLFFGNVDGYVAIGTSPIRPDSNNAYADLISGKRGVIASITPPSELSRSFGVDYTSESAIWLEADCIKGSFELKGSSKRFLEAVVDVLLNKNFQEMLINMINSEYYGMAYDYDYEYEDEYYDCGIEPDDIY